MEGLLLDPNHTDKVFECFFVTRNFKTESHHLLEVTDLKGWTDSKAGMG